MNSNINIEIIDHIKKGFGKNVSLNYIKDSLYQLYIPYYHTDGDMIDIFLDINSVNRIVVKDLGLTLMRLSYKVDLNNDNRKSIFHQITKTYGIKYDEINGNLYKLSSGEELYGSITDMIQSIIKISDISYLKEERIKSMFYNIFENLIETKLGDLGLKKDVIFENIDSKGYYKVPYLIESRNHAVPIIILPILNTERTNEYLSKILYYKNNKLHFRSIAVFNDFTKISNIPALKMIDEVDKSFTNFEDKKTDIVDYTREFVNTL